MPDKFIPEHIDPFRFAEQHFGLTGTLKIADMPRLRPSLGVAQGHVAVNMQFGIDEQGITFLKGHIETTLTLHCQRCLEPFEYEIISDFVLGIINSLEEVNNLPERYEPALAKEGHLAVRELIEDEIILNLPVIAKHEPENCTVKMPQSDASWEEIKQAKSPFHVLASLKNKDH